MEVLFTKWNDLSNAKISKYNDLKIKYIDLVSQYEANKNIETSSSSLSTSVEKNNEVNILLVLIILIERKKKVKKLLNQ